MQLPLKLWRAGQGQPRGFLTFTLSLPPSLLLCLSVSHLSFLLWTHEFLFYLTDYSKLLSLFIVTFKFSQICPGECHPRWLLFPFAMSYHSLITSLYSTRRLILSFSCPSPESIFIPRYPGSFKWKILFK